ncbi:hypothetical protein PFICI_06421 [Pestalotiopsis fici W106-1]|uniref:WKF domain-containing protein n=1 Tax=Pestalotiopsis fici (strain W106-1 / CGMCC3.15140) TaxID=1229662 RepID=W3X5W5_PESFW|nr:uncharacterized protein PFICI_06421 [Pestalotiopsis fici W106-1]ETS81419.1 hypothetical protein PFICI_06421 [Pestalotiopsis fici W106-1]
MSSDARVPAWKRLGLKLKAGADTQADSAAPSQKSIASPDTTPSGSAKRKSSGPSAQDPYAKKPRREDTNNATTAKTKPKTPKSVSFAAETEELAPPKPATNGQKVPKRQKQKSEKPITETPKGTQPNTAVKPLVKKQNAVANLQSAIEYLRQWHTARDSWKFNKNHQTRLLEYVFSDETTIPAVDINVFYEYIRPLKGFVRKRLRQTAAEVKSKDMEKGSEAFSASGKEAAARKQQEYEGVIAGYLEQERTPGKRRFEEMDYVLRTADMEMQRRVVKRMRAEMILDELPESDDSESSTGTATLTETETETENTTGEGSAEGQAANSEGDKRIKLNDGSQRRLRRNKVRTAEVEDDSSSSSEDDSDSESDTTSSGSESSSDDESDSENAMDVDPARNEEETSSSSSSSSSESDSDSDDDSSEEEA